MKLTAETFKTEVLNGKGTVLVDFYADWCGPCKMMTPVLEKLAEDHPEITVAKLNVDEEMEIALQYGVQSIPMLIVFKNGIPTAKTIGYTEEPELEELISK